MHPTFNSLLPNFFWSLYRRDPGPCGLGDFPTGRGFGRVRALGSGGLGPAGVGRAGFLIRLCHERCAGSTRSDAWRALLWRSFPAMAAGRFGPAARSTQEQVCFCERDCFVSTLVRQRRTSRQLQKTVTARLTTETTGPRSGPSAARFFRTGAGDFKGSGGSREWPGRLRSGSLSFGT